MRDDFLTLDRNIYWTTSMSEMRKFLIAKNEEMRIVCVDMFRTTVHDDVFACANSRSYIHKDIKGALVKDGVCYNSLLDVPDGINAIIFIPKSNIEKGKGFPTFRYDTWDYLHEYETFYIGERDVANRSGAWFIDSFGTPIRTMIPDEVEEFQESLKDTKHRR